MNPIEIDGSYGEGGGQILRSALALSMITDTPFRLVNLRAKRDQPGLRPQHLTAVQAAASIAQAEVTGAQVNSQTLEFTPHRIKPGSFIFDVSTAGSTLLVLQTLLPPLCFASKSSHLVLRGGTHVPWSPSFHYIATVFLPMLKRMGVQAEAKLLKAGWYPRGGGEIAVTIIPTGKIQLQPLILNQRGSLRRVTVYALISNLPAHIAQRECDRAADLLQDLDQVKPKLDIQPLPAIGQGTMVVLVAEFKHTVVGFSAMGRIGKRAEQVAEEAVQPFLEFYPSDATVDSHLADQLLLYVALAGKGSYLMTNQFTEHVRTNIWLIEKFLPVEFQVQGELDNRAIITLQS
jgi:RNA 3'-terminal phosphate cyclase (ATP)